jgi:hypothetical protein
MTGAEIIAWADEAARRVAEDKTGTPLTEKQLQRIAALKRKAPKRGIRKLFARCRVAMTSLIDVGTSIFKFRASVSAATPSQRNSLSCRKSSSAH